MAVVMICPERVDGVTGCAFYQMFPHQIHGDDGTNLYYTAMATILDAPPRVALANQWPFRRGERAGPHASASELYLPVRQGRGSVTVDGQRFELTAGHVLYAPWGAIVDYAADAREPMAVIGIHLVPRAWTAPREPPPPHAAPGHRARLPPPPALTLSNRPFLVLPPPGAGIFDCAEAIADAWLLEDDVDREPRLRALALSLAIEMRACRHGAPAATDHPRAGAVRALSSWMELNLHMPMTRGGLASRAGMSETGLAAAFRAVLGRSPIDHLIELRIARARRLLVSGNDTVAHVGAQVGIGDLAYFSKVFKRRTGLPPLAYRRRHRG
jgi:AraC-like DNA-binding protein/quercetin dioxygenase-like cupin family protein